MLFQKLTISRSWSINIGKKQGRNEFVIRLQPSEAMYMKLTVSNQPRLNLYITGYFNIMSEESLSYVQLMTNLKSVSESYI